MTNEEEKQDLFKGFGVRVKLKGKFVRVRDTLARIGIADIKHKKLIQSCHIFHKQGEYAIMHFLEMFLFDNKEANFTEADEARRNRIVKMLESWDLIENLDGFDEEDPIADYSSVAVIPRADVDSGEWELVKKYTIGGRKPNAT